MKVVSCIIARTTSTRLPLKVLRGVNTDLSKSMLDIIIAKAKQSTLTDKIVLCTSSERCDDILNDVALRNDIDIYRGDADEVINRLLNVAENENADYVIRITGDNVFVAGEYIDQQIALCVENDLDYCRLSNVPIGATAELIKVAALKEVAASIDPVVSEYLMLFIFNPEVFRCGILQASSDYSHYGITVDTDDDLKNIKEIIKLLGDSASDLSLKSICELLVDRKDLFNCISSETSIKMPYNKEITFDDFKKDQDYRVRSSLCVEKISNL